MSSDFLQRFIFEDVPVRGEFVHLEQSFQEILQQHAYPAPIRQLLGEALCVAALLSAIIKFNGRLTVQFKGKGKLKLLLAQCNNQFQIRGLAKWDGDLSYEDLMDAFNEGVLMIMLDSGTNTLNRYQGIVSWTGNSLAESIESYFRESEQLATKLWLEVSDNAIAGLLLQVVPGKTNINRDLENELFAPHWDRLTKLTYKINPEDMFTLDYKTLLRYLYPDDEIRIFSEVPIVFQCTCSRKKGSDAIALLGREEAEAELQTHNTIVVTCDFCNKEYIFDKIDIESIFKNESPPPTQLH